MQRIYPEKLNTIAIPLWIVVVNATLRVQSDDPYPTDIYMFK